MRSNSVVAFSVGVALALSACGSTSRSTSPRATPASSATDDPVSAAYDPVNDSRDAISDLLIHHRYHHHGGFLMLVTMSLDTLGLAADQRARVEEIRQDLLAKMQPTRAAERSVEGALAEGVEQSFIDRKRVDAAIANLGDASAALHETAIADLNRLHDQLAPPERAALMEKAESQWRLWKAANAGDKNPVDALSEEVGLTHLQLEQVRRDFNSESAATPLREKEVEQHLRDFDRSFRSDHFDARQLMNASPANRHMAEWGAWRLARYCEVVDPVLTPEQRNVFVSLLREHLSHDESQAGGS